MDKTSRFYFFTKLAVKLLISFLILGFAMKLIKSYLMGLHDISDEVIGVVSVLVIIVRVHLMIGFVLIILYFVYIGFRYMTSGFYSASKIPLHEAYYHGYLDMAYVYDRLRSLGDIKYDTKRRSILVSHKDKNYMVLVREYFGTIIGDARSSNWYIGSKKRKEYGRIKYKKKIPIVNPVEENKAAINEYREREGITCTNLVCLTGLQRNTFNNPAINTVYEIEALII